ncbi:MAG: hypothetical protein K2O36_03710, partial [Ruminococcus sp.]|nr:hypothetical protein [Ruminococcus sp.]
MKFKNKKEWDKIVEINKDDGYGMGVIRYAEKWAGLMEEQISNGKTVYDCAEKTSHDADTEGITGFMYGMAVNILSQVWEHGEDLRKWHNKEYGYEGKGVVNPAIIT